jgi:hypothetical protein
MRRAVASGMFVDAWYARLVPPQYALAQSKSGRQRVRDLMGEEAEELLRHRFEIVNEWRPIRRDSNEFVIEKPCSENYVPALCNYLPCITSQRHAGIGVGRSSERRG